jgi:small nuclear ribonucleoprotein (snRNP)-like protein
MAAEQVLTVLRDGRHLVGYLRSFDQYCEEALVHRNAASSGQVC